MKVAHALYQGGHKSTQPSIRIVILDTSMKSLQEEFCQTQGAPVERSGKSIIQMDRIPLSSGKVTITFQTPPRKPLQGVALKVSRGGLVLPDGKQVKLLYVWNSPGCPSAASYGVKSLDGELRLWNIYKLDERSESLETAEQWTGNAGMIVEPISGFQKRYCCSNGVGAFTPDDLIFTALWE